MNTIWGAVLTTFSLIGWLGQTITVLSPKLATKLELTEQESDVDSAFYADVRGEALWDMLILWILPVAGILLLLNNSSWAYFGLVGGGMYFYFAGRGIVVRRTMQRRGIRVGTQKSLKVIYMFLTLSGVIALITIVKAASALL
ncbi:hypothetical protein ACFLRW_01015 [Acidobacteriota bacterium]